MTSVIRHNFSELVKELTLAVQNNEHEEVKIVELEKLPHNSELSFPVFFKHFINTPTTTHGRSVRARQIKGHK